MFFNFNAQVLKKFNEHAHIQDIGYVAYGDFFLADEGTSQYLQGFIFCSLRSYLARERVASVNFKTVHTLQSTKRAERLKIIRVIFFLELELIISVAIAHITHVWIAISIVTSVIIISVEGSFRKPLRVYRIDGRKV